MFDEVMNVRGLRSSVRVSDLPADLSVDEDYVIQSQDQFGNFCCSLVLPVNTGLLSLLIQIRYLYLLCASQGVLTLSNGKMLQSEHRATGRSKPLS